MTPEEYRREQDGIKAQAVALAAAIVAEIRKLGRPLSPGARQRVLDLLLEAILDARGKSTRAALRMHADQSPRGFSPDIKEPHYEPAAVDDLLSRTIDRIDFDEVSWPKVEREVTDSVGRHVDMAARDASVAAVHSDADAVGFARVLQGEKNCAFCVLLASRGPVYGSRYLAGDPDIRRFHDGCDCVVVAVFDESNWAGRDAWVDAKAIYDKYGKGERDPLNGIRRHLDSTKREQDDRDSADAA